MEYVQLPVTLLNDSLRVVLTAERRACRGPGAYVVDSFDGMMVELAQNWVLQYITKRSDAAVGNLTLADIYVLHLAENECCGKHGRSSCSFEKTTNTVRLLENMDAGWTGARRRGSSSINSRPFCSLAGGNGKGHEMTQR